MSQQTAAASAAPAGSTPKPGACAMVIFGGGGDLTKRLVTPALYNLATTGLLPDDFAIIGVDHSDNSDEAWRESLSDMTKKFVGEGGTFDTKAWDWLQSRMFYLKGDFEDPKTFESIKAKLGEVEKSHKTGGSVLFYLAVADRFFGTVVDGIGKAELTKVDGDGPWRRVVIEKPFGHDLNSAKALNERVLKVLGEDQVYRIDHFLGKETVQNIMAFRFANGLFEPLWNRDHIDHVQITVAEVVGVESHGGFYEGTGALRDMVPNHVFQLVAMIAMEPPVSFDADDVRSRKVDLFKSMKTVEPNEAVRGQYGAGEEDGKPTRSYRDEPHVDPKSNTDTYVALKLEIDNWRWAGVPFYVRTGKYLPERTTEIAIRFKTAPMALFQSTPVSDIQANWIAIQIQPDEGISLQFEVKQPGPTVDLKSVKMSFAYKDWFKPQKNVGYETLLYDVMIGDQTLFQRADQVEEAWRVVDGVLDHWNETAPEDFPNYAGGSAGPEAADRLLSEGGRSWRPIRLDPGPKQPEDKPK